MGEQLVSINWKSRPAIVSGVIGAAAVAGIVAFALRDRFTTAPPRTDDANKKPATAADVVELSGGKLAAADIKTVVVRAAATRTLHGHAVPGRVTYDETRHVEVRTPSEGVLTKVVVNPGDRVATGDVLAWVTSREIGTARADVLKRKAERDLAADWLKRKQTLAENVTKLADDLSRRKPFATIQKQYASRTLGDYREKLIAAYSRYLLAAEMHKSVAGLDRSGAIPGTTLMLHAKELRSSEAALGGACEQSKLDSHRDRDVARAAAVDAEHRLRIAQQHLASLLLAPGMVDGQKAEGRRPKRKSKVGKSKVESRRVESRKVERRKVKQPAIRPSVLRPSTFDLRPSDLRPLALNDDGDLDNLSRLAIRAPIAGTIETRHFTAGERLKQSDSLFLLAETSRLWIEADLRENEWSALNLAVGRVLHVTSPAFPGKSLTARVYQLGRQVSAETNSIPLIAEIDNADGKLRPGLFVRVTLPVAAVYGSAATHPSGVAAGRDALFVPESALMRHEGVSFVFVQLGKGRFRRVNVKTGITSGRQVEVVSGLKEGSRIVSEGAFVLKSELLLEREE